MKVKLRSEQTFQKNIATRREMRRSRRNRKTRYRKPRFNNRRKKDGWLPPSVEQRLESHKQEIAFVHSILPITEVILERNDFDIQKIKNPDIKGKEYQQGEQLDYLNVRAYVLFRDHYTCQCCKGKSKDKKLQTHHIESRKTGGDAPNNFVTLCKTCHTYYHQGKLKLPKRIKRDASYRDATMMNIIMERLYKYLKNTYPNVKDTYGYITKNIRETYDLPKEHYIDARCITGHPLARTDGTLYQRRKLRCHNRQIHRMTPMKKGIRRRSQSEYKIFGFRLYDKVKCKDQIGYITGKRTRGSFTIKTYNGQKLTDGISYKKLRFLETRKNYITNQTFLPDVNIGVPTFATN